jgi:hypothetical protein
MAEFNISPYARSLGPDFEYGDRISVVLDSTIKNAQQTQAGNGNSSQFFSYLDYRESIERSISNMLSESFEEIIFEEEAQENGLVLYVYRITPKIKAGEFIEEEQQAIEFVFDYDMSLSYDQSMIANAVGYDAHPVVSSPRYNRIKNNWEDLAQASLKLVLEDCYNQLFVVGLAEH